MADQEELNLVVGLKDELSSGLGKMLSSIDNVRTAVGKLPAPINQLEKSLATASARAGMLDVGIKKGVSGIPAAAAKLKEYQDQLAKLNVNPSTGKDLTTGRFVSKAAVDEVKQATNAVNALQKSQSLMQETAKNGLMKDLAADAKAYGQTVKGMEANLRSFQATMAAIGDKNGEITNKGAQYVGAGGKVLSKADVDAYYNAAAGIKEITRQQNAMAISADTATPKMGRLEKGLVGLANSTPSLRYALYDVSNALAVSGAALVAGGVAAGLTAISFERSFANVERVTHGTAVETENMRKQFIGLAQTLPVTFDQLTEIGALGGQLGVSSAGISKFTTVVAQLTATTNLSAEAAGTALGRFKAILGVSENEFTNLASSILKVGINSVATETQIVNVATSISSMAAFAGMTADQVIGLSGALASVGAPPELSRGVITRLFTQMSKAVAGGGEGLKNFASVAGVSSSQFADAWGTDKFSSVFLSFMQGISSSGGDAVSVLNQLGITSVRDVPLLMRLAGAADEAGTAGALLAQTMRDAKNGWTDNVELATQYAKVAGTVAERLKVLLGNFQVLLDAIGSNGIPIFNALIDVGINLLKMLTDMANNPFGAWIIGLGVGATALVGVFALMGATAARSYASLIALSQAIGLNAIAANGALVPMSVLTAEMMAAGGAAKYAAVGIKVLSVAMKALSVVGLGLAAVEIGGWALGVGQDIGGLSTSVAGLIDTMSQGKEALGGKLLEGFDFFNMTEDARAAGKELEQFAHMAVAARHQMGDRFDLVTDLNLDPGNMGGKIRDLDGALTQMVSGGKAEEAAESFKAFADANEKAGYTTENLNKLFPQYTALLAGTSGATDDASAKQAFFAEQLEATADARAKLQEELAAGIDSFVTNPEIISKNIADQKAAAEAVADRFNKENESTDAAKRTWEDYYDGQSINLQSYLTDLEASVAAQEAWQANLTGLMSKIPPALVQELTRMGPESAGLVQALSTATEPELAKYVDLWGRSGSDAAIQFAASLLLQEDAMNAAANFLGKQGGGAARTQFLKEVEEGRMPFTELLKKYGLDAQGNPIPISANDQPARDTTNGYMRWVAQQRANLDVTATIINKGQLESYLGTMNMSLAGKNRENAGNFWSGGYTGPGAKFQPAGVVHKDEFVFDKESTRRIGVQNLYSMMRGQSMARGYATGGQVGRPAPSGTLGTGIVALDAQTMRSLARILRVELKIPGYAISEAAGSANVSSNSRGAY